MARVDFRRLRIPITAAVSANLLRVDAVVGCDQKSGRENTADQPFHQILPTLLSLWEPSLSKICLHMGYGIPFKTIYSPPGIWHTIARRFIVSIPPEVNPRPKLTRVVASGHQGEDPLAIASSRRVFDEVYVRLRSAIIKGHFAAGERFVERSLTARLQVSRTPIREAIKRLEQEGLVVCYPHRGCFVRSPSFDEAREAYEMRRVAEGFAGELAATRATDAELQAIHDLVKATRVRLEAGDREELLLRNDEFHSLQARGAKNTFLEQHLKTLWAYVDLVRGRWWMEADRAFATQSEHEAIVEALLKRDPLAARERNVAHVDNAWRVVEAGFKSIGGYGESTINGQVNRDHGT